MISQTWTSTKQLIIQSPFFCFFSFNILIWIQFNGVSRQLDVSVLGCEELETRIFCFSMCWDLAVGWGGSSWVNHGKKNELIPSDGIGFLKGTSILLGEIQVGEIWWDYKPPRSMDRFCGFSEGFAFCESINIQGAWMVAGYISNFSKRQWDWQWTAKFTWSFSIFKA